MNKIQIGNRSIGKNEKVFIIAEVGVNHNGNVDMAHILIDKSVEIGADCVKFQSFITEKLVTASAPKAAYQKRSTRESHTQFDMLKKLELRSEDFFNLKKHCDEKGIIFLSTPYDKISADYLDNIGVCAYKIASTDTTNTPFLSYVGEKGKPVIISTGMCTLGEVEKAIDTLDETSSRGKVIALHCTSEYPTMISEVNLKVINTLESAFDIPIGFSDHTEGIGASPWAVVRGACVIEKHFTMDKKLPGPDHKASLDVEEFSELILQIRNVEKALGDGVKRITKNEYANKRVMQKSIVTIAPLRCGEIVTEDKIEIMRPGNGLSPDWYPKVLGKSVLEDIPEFTVLELHHINWKENGE